MSDEHTRRSRAAAEILETLYQRAVTRYLEASGFDVRKHLTEEELAQYHTAEQAAFEQTLGQPTAIGKVVIEVLGGVAEVTSKPDHVEVTIIDHDNEESSALDRSLECVDRPQLTDDECSPDDGEANVTKGVAWS
jgi:hypothetical protein